MEGLGYSQLYLHYLEIGLLLHITLGDAFEAIWKIQPVENRTSFMLMGEPLQQCYMYYVGPEFVATARLFPGK